MAIGPVHGMAPGRARVAEKKSDTTQTVTAGAIVARRRRVCLHLVGDGTVTGEGRV